MLHRCLHRTCFGCSQVFLVEKSTDSVGRIRCIFLWHDRRSLEFCASSSQSYNFALFLLAVFSHNLFLPGAEYEIRSVWFTGKLIDFRNLWHLIGCCSL